MPVVQIVLGGTPQGKGRPRFVRATGHAFTPAATRRYESALRYAAQQAMGTSTPLDGPLCVVVVAIFPIPASWSGKKRAEALSGSLWPTVTPDADNLLKVLDALNEIVWRDDKQVVDARVVKRYGERARLIIEVREIATLLANCAA
ncbi:MAG: RusA family crossover junction endodeoxyribonuclease [Hyphomicrobiales bacterium]|nr:RusA family crossover junction endodeoxyribonuclease [Hyphomicrobiales bacterium]